MAQEALADPRRQWRGAAPASHGAGDCGAVLVVQGQWSIRHRGRATLMRHEIDDAAVERGGVMAGADIAGGVTAGAVIGRIPPPLAPTARARRVSQSADTAVLVATARRTPRLQACRARTRMAAVALAAIAQTAQQHLLATPRAHEQAGGVIDQLPAPREGLPRHAACGRDAVLGRRTTAAAYTASTSRFTGAV